MPTEILKELSDVKQEDLNAKLQFFDRINKKIDENEAASVRLKKTLPKKAIKKGEL